MQSGNIPTFAVETAENMKKQFALLFTLCLCFLGCSKNSQNQCSWYEDNGKPKVLSTLAMIDDLVDQIGQDKVDHITLIHGEIDPHSYELVKGDDEKFAFAQIVFGNGLGLEHGASLRYQMESHKHAVFLADEIQKAQPDRILQVEGEVDPHLWMDISLWSKGIDAIVNALVKEDPENQFFYERNGVLLREKMLSTHADIQNQLSEIPEKKRYLVTSHDAFHYFAVAYLGGMDRCVAPEGLAPEGQLSHKDIKRVVDILNTHQIQVVFPESNVSRDALKKIVTCCDHNVRISPKVLYGDAMGADNYLGMIQHNAKVLLEEWNQN